MNKIQCSVCSCSHNKDNACYANRVNIGGIVAKTESQTCCGSFLNRLLYSDLTNNTNNEGHCDSLVCFVKTCKHNCNSLCDLSEIAVSGANAEVYDETCCDSFDDR